MEGLFLFFYNDFLPYLASQSNFILTKNFQIFFVYAYLNYKLSTIFGVHSALELFGTESYPTTTKQVYQVIKNHIDNFDNLY